MADWEELLKAGIVAILGGMILGSVALAGISQQMVSSFVNLGIFLIVLSIVVFVIGLFMKSR